MGGVAKAIFGGGGGDVQAAVALPAAPPVAPPAYTQPTPAGAAGNVSEGAKAAGAFANTIITGPEGLKQQEKTATPSLKSQLGN
jgi:hypothetical protein